MDEAVCWFDSISFKEMKEPKFSWNLLTSSFSPAQVAGAIYDMNMELFMSIPGSEFINCNWSKKGKENNAPMLLKAISNFSSQAISIVTLIINQESKVIITLYKRYVCVFFFFCCFFVETSSGYDGFLH